MSQTIRLCTWNIQLGLQLDTILDAFKRHRDLAELDLLALQEASIHHGRADARALADALGPTYDCYQVTAHFLNGREQANALVWNAERLQVHSKDQVRLPYAREVKLSRREHALLRALPTQPRLSLVIEGALGAHSLRIYVAHLDVVGFTHKREQFSRILNDARTRPPVELTIVAGDLNTFRIRSRPTWRQLSAAAQAEGFQDLTDEVQWTHAVPQLRIRQKLDAIFIRHASPLQSRAWSLDIAGSDHIPVFAEIIV
jgi:endonuclease/exonuclease/phosphatase family metal-dependent hydrolase